ncbi:MAG: superoxide dismutase [Tannerella sp.]|nr:superoxide dismutase [Tannerella sp.]
MVLVCLGSANAQFTLPPLPYANDALEPYIDSVTMRIHHDTHHAAYVNNVNTALKDQNDLKDKSLDWLLNNVNNLPEAIRTVVRNNGGGHYNHSFFWTSLAPAGTTAMSAKTEKALVDNFGSVDNFKAEFEKAAVGRFGSGWAWLIQLPDGKLKIISTPNQDNPLMPVVEPQGAPILALDVWEHAYYLKYQSKRAAYAAAFWNVVNWDKIDKLLK